MYSKHLGYLVYLSLFFSLPCASAWNIFSTSSMYNGKTCGENESVFSTNISTRIGCMLLCVDDSSCVAAFYREDGDCVGCSVHASQNEATLLNDPETTYLTDTLMCRAGWMEYEGTCYLMETVDKKTWTAAQAFCKQADGMLAEIRTSAVQTFIASQLSLYNLNGASLNVWIGAVKENGSFVWSSNKEGIVVTQWGDGEPNYGVNEDCVGMFPNSGYKWNDSPCNLAQLFVCEMETV